MIGYLLLLALAQFMIQLQQKNMVIDKYLNNSVMYSYLYLYYSKTVNVSKRKT